MSFCLVKANKTTHLIKIHCKKMDFKKSNFLYITALPEILASDLKDQSVYESTPVSFEIIAQGTPKLEVQWTLNDKPLKSDNHYTITEDNLKYKLSIADVKLYDAGAFKVTAKNKLGELSKQCVLNIMRK